MREILKGWFCSGKIIEFTAIIMVVAHSSPAELFFEPFDSKPYLNPTKPSGNSVYISWNTAVLDSTMVAYGLTSALGDTVRRTTEDYYHHALLPGLTPATTYYYRVLPSGDIKTFTTFAVTTDSFCFIAYGDTRTDSVSHQAVIDQMVNHPFEFVIHGGDLVGTGDNTDEWRIFFNTVDTVLQSKLFLPTIGNHELPFWPYDTLFVLPDSEDYYSVDYANCHFIGLNTSIDLAGAQKTWLIDDVSLASTNPAIDWIFAVFHRPPYSSGMAHGSQLDVQTEWCPVFEQYGVDMVFAGHDHIYERTIAINGVVYIVTGGGGAPLHAVGSNSWTAYAESTYHFCWLKVKGKRLEFSAIKPDGTVFDSVMIEKPVGIADLALGKTARLSVIPNPFRKKIEIRYMILDAGCNKMEEANQNIEGSARRSSGQQHPGLKIYDAAGRCIKSFILPTVVTWSGDDEHGVQVPTGVYFAVVEDGYQRVVAKIIKEK